MSTENNGERSIFQIGRNRSINEIGVAIRVLAFSSSFDPRYRNKEETNRPFSPRVTNPIPPRLIQGCLVLMTFSR
jgi:hypothetical protein